ncbi:hypothetical protein [Endozoicomonas sp. SESOKO1]|uniref:hypothetical protein n=1 Tax=Endozoicomonas sp. SESOKO1 TaxID=2828742 RepID=UPI0021493B2C|nr:hypothetical protein [Endozoicomonas sp. SESOKO1]
MSEGKLTLKAHALMAVLEPKKQHIQAYFKKNDFNGKTALSKSEVETLIKSIEHEDSSPYIQHYNQVFRRWNLLDTPVKSVKSSTSDDVSIKYEILMNIITDEQKQEMEKQYKLQDKLQKLKDTGISKTDLEQLMKMM